MWPYNGVVDGCLGLWMFLHYYAYVLSICVEYSHQVTWAIAPFIVPATPTTPPTKWHDDRSIWWLLCHTIRSLLHAYMYSNISAHHTPQGWIPWITFPLSKGMSETNTKLENVYKLYLSLHCIQKKSMWGDIDQGTNGQNQKSNNLLTFVFIEVST